MEERLQQFRGLIDAGSFTRAAAELHISQPALSNAIAKLERELKTILVDRRAHPLVPTPAGKRAYTTAIAVLQQRQQLMSDLEHLTGHKPTLRLGMIDSVASAFCADSRLLNEVEEDYHVRLSVDNSRTLEQSIAKGDLDIALVVGKRSVSRTTAYQAIFLGIEPLVIVAHVDMPEERRSHIISYDKGSFTHQLIADAFARARYPFNPNFYSTSPEIILQLVLQQRGPAILPFSRVRTCLEQGLLISYSLGTTHTISRPITALIGPRNGEQQHFLDALRSLLQSLYMDAMRSLDNLAEQHRLVPLSSSAKT